MRVKARRRKAGAGRAKKRPGGADSSCDAVAKLLQCRGDALAERRCPALRESLADREQCPGWKTGPLAAPINGGGSDAHLRALRVRGARRFSRSRRALTLRLARFRSIVMPDFFPCSWPERNASPTSEAVNPVAMMTVIGSMLFCVLCSDLGGGAAESLKQEHPHKAGKAHALRVSVFAGLSDDFGRQRNASGFRSFVRWDFALGHR